MECGSITHADGTRQQISSNVNGSKSVRNCFIRFISASNPTLAFSCGARAAFGLNCKGYLRAMLSRRQLQGFVRWNRRAQLRLFGLLLVRDNLDPANIGIFDPADDGTKRFISHARLTLDKNNPIIGRFIRRQTSYPFGDVG